ncbi:MAG: ABC transporter ATP-binding protein [Clostridiaceae bacterium]|nr:ABC transporter ATP-binding protein [Clostridiaceae bacterium]
MSMLRVENLSVAYGELKIVDDISFEVSPQQWLMIVGPNGAGKRTIIKAITQEISYLGNAFFLNRDIADIKSAELARNIGVLSQSNNVGYSFTVEEIVRLGRYAWRRGPLAAEPQETEAKIEHALEITGMTSLRRQSVMTLSGGELQRTFLAQLFAQDPKLLILDEPTNHLDLVYQKQMFELIGKWLSQPDRAVISVVHDLSLAKAYGTHALLLNQGKIAAAGQVNEALSTEKLEKVYKMDVHAWMQGLLQYWQPQNKGRLE